MPAPQTLARAVAIVGVGETDYGADYAAGRNATGPALDTLLVTAFDRALNDSGLLRADVDGLIHSAEPEFDSATVAGLLGIAPRVLMPGDSVTPMGGPPGAMGTIARAVGLLARGECNVLALIYGAASRTAAKQFGGTTYVGDSRSSYYFHHPWGWSSQAAHWALMLQEYRHRYGGTEEDLAAVAITLRAHAALNDNAIMRTPLAVADYLASPYIVRPLRRLDLCLPCDGAVCVILRRADEAGEQAPVISGWGNAWIRTEKLHYMVRELLRVELGAAGNEAFAMAELSRADIGHFQGYDASTFHLANQIEGYGLVPDGTALQGFRSGHFSVGGALPVNTSGGMLSQAYLHGWNHLVEATRQLRHQAAARQVPDLAVSMLSVAWTDSAHTVLLERGGGR